MKSEKTPRGVIRSTWYVVRAYDVRCTGSQIRVLNLLSVRPFQGRGTIRRIVVGSAKVWHLHYRLVQTESYLQIPILVIF